MITKRFDNWVEIGRGGMGVVYRATDTQAGQVVAIKELSAAVATTDMIGRFKREGEALRELNHPNIVRLIDVVESDNQYYLVMEYMAGGSLRDLLDKTPQLPLNHLLNIALDVADALTRAHRLDIIHRDLKPANILLANDGTPRLADFGIAQIGEAPHDLEAGIIMGTFQYISPEILQSHPPNNLSDIWSFGIMLFEMLAGHRPFQGDSPTKLALEIIRQPLPDLETLCPTAPITLIDLIYRMLAKNPIERIPSVRIIGSELEALLQGRTPDTRPVPTQDKGDKTVIVEGRFATPTPVSLSHNKHNFPVQLTPFVGREHELAELSQLLHEYRLVTILAPGGMGKTRLASEVGQQLFNMFADGVYIVELAPLSDPDNIANAIAEAVNYPIQPDERSAQQQVLEFLSNKHMLLILDNFEHLLDGASLITEIMQNAPQVSILVTSRQRLNQTNEAIFNLDGMDFPDWEDSQDAFEFSAVQLFIQSARRIQIAFKLTPDNLGDITRICQLVQGLPLGIVLAAAWLDMLSLAEIADEIEQSIDFLSTEMTDIPERQRSIRGVFEYSWALLTNDERDVFKKLSVFRGGMTRQAIQAVTGAGLRTLQALVNKSLLQRYAETGRYAIHELLRQYGEEALEDANTIRDAHAHYYLNAVAELEPDIKGARQKNALEQIETDFENVKVAWLWAIQQRDEEAIDAAIETLLWFSDFYLHRAADFMALREKALAVFTQGEIRGKLLRSLPGAPASSLKADVDEALAIMRTHNNRHEEGRCLVVSGISYWGIGEERIELLKKGLTICRELDDDYYTMLALASLGLQSNALDQTDAAQDYLAEAINISRYNGDRTWLAQLLYIKTSVTMKSLTNWLSVVDDLQEIRDIGIEMNMPLRTFSADFRLSAIDWLQGNFQSQKQRAVANVKLTTRYANAYFLGHSIIQLAMAYCMHEDYILAESELLKASELLVAYNVNAHRDLLFYKAFVYWGLRQPDIVREAIWQVRKALGNNVPTPTRFCYRLAPALAYLRASEGQYIKATQLLSFAKDDYWNPAGGWLDKWPAIERLQTELETQLGTDVYQQAWKTGKTLDLETALNTLMPELLKELGDDIPN